MKEIWDEQDRFQLILKSLCIVDDVKCSDRLLEMHQAAIGNE